MKYYRFRSTSAQRAFLPTSARGVALPGEIKWWLLPEIYAIVPGNKDVRDVRHLSQLPDVVYATIYFLLSDAARSAIENVELDPEISIVKTHAMNRASRALGDCWALYGCERGVLDRKKATYTPFIVKPELVLEVHRWVLDPALIPPYDMFMGDTGKWIVTERLRYRLEAEGITGYELIEIGNYD